MTSSHDDQHVRATTAVSARTVVGLFDGFEEAERAAGALRDAGFPLADVSVVARPPGTPPQIAAEQTHSRTGSTAGALGGAVLGGIAALAIPGIGPVLAVGPIASFLAGAVGGAATGGFIGSFLGLDVPTARAEHYEARVREGGVFVAVRTPDAAEAARARDVLAGVGAQDVADYQAGL